MSLATVLFEIVIVLQLSGFSHFRCTSTLLYQLPEARHVPTVLNSAFPSTFLCDFLPVASRIGSQFACIAWHTSRSCSRTSTHPPPIFPIFYITFLTSDRSCLIRSVLITVLITAFPGPLSHALARSLPVLSSSYGSRTPRAPADREASSLFPSLTRLFSVLQVCR